MTRLPVPRLYYLLFCASTVLMVDIKGHVDGCPSFSFLAVLPFRTLVFGCSRADDLASLCEWHVTLHLFVFSVSHAAV